MSQQLTTSEAQDQQVSIRHQSLAEWIATEPEDGAILVHLAMREVGIFFEEVFPADSALTIAQAAEQAVASYLTEQDRFPDSLIYAKVYWADGAAFGPFPVEVSIQVEAASLRGGE